MRVAIIGAGVSGNVSAWLLRDIHEVTLFEARHEAGGHTQTIDVEAYGRSYRVDTGFMVFNNTTYPLFTKLLNELHIAAQPSDMSFSVRCERSGWEYQGSSLSGLFAQRRNLWRLEFYRMLADIVGFNRRATHLRSELPDDVSLGEFLQRGRYGQAFVERYLVPMTAAIWSAPPSTILEMPARFLFEFFHNHGLLKLRNRPQWQTVRGGAQTYVKALVQHLGPRLRVSTPIERIEREDDQVRVTPRGGSSELFDAVIVACHADQALRLLLDADERERHILNHFAYQRNEAVIHTDAEWLPRRRAAWASWNYRVGKGAHELVNVTYDVNRLQRLGAPGPLCVTLNPSSAMRPSHVIRRLEYHHPVFRAGCLEAQRAQTELNGRRRTYFCGAYWGYGFHEDGVRSAYVACKPFLPNVSNN